MAGKPSAGMNRCFTMVFMVMCSYIMPGALRLSTSALTSAILGRHKQYLPGSLLSSTKLVRMHCISEVSLHCRTDRIHPAFLASRKLPSCKQTVTEQPEMLLSRYYRLQSTLEVTRSLLCGSHAVSRAADLCQTKVPCAVFWSSTA